MYVQEQQQVQTIDVILDHIYGLQSKLMDCKAVLKHYKIKSDRLDQLKKAKKELQEQINDEKDRIENEYYADSDYEKARNDELTYKNEIKQEKAMLKQKLASKYRSKEQAQMITDKRLVRGEQLKLQLEFTPNVYLNGNKI